jgi:chorismate mutase/prephenate dehydratase
VFRLAEAGEALYGVVPVENSTEGGVNSTLDLLLDTPLVISNEVELKIAHCLLAQPGAGPPAQIAAHQQALAQCRQWLAAHFPGVPLVAKASNADAARSAGADKTIYAVASATTAPIYDLEIKVRNIEDNPGNTTRFLVLSTETVGRSGRDKTSLVMSNTNQPGSLYQQLAPLADAGISMTRIESRPMRAGLWEYVFFVDIEGHIEDPKVEAAVEAIKKESAFFKVLGSYPRGL